MPLHFLDLKVDATFQPLVRFSIVRGFEVVRELLPAIVQAGHQDAFRSTRDQTLPRPGNTLFASVVLGRNTGFGQGPAARRRGNARSPAATGRDPSRATPYCLPGAWSDTARGSASQCRFGCLPCEPLQISDRGQQLTRFYGAYANRIRKALFKDTSQTPSQTPSYGSAPQPEPEPASACTRPTRASWARLIRKVFEVDPRVCSPCGAEMKILAVITEPAVVDRILSRLETSSTQARPPPASLNHHESVPAL